MISLSLSSSSSSHDSSSSSHDPSTLDPELEPASSKESLASSSSDPEEIESIESSGYAVPNREGFYGPFWIDSSTSFYAFYI